MKRFGAAVIVLGVLTAIQAGTGLWRIVVMYQEGLRKRPLPFELSTGLLEEVALSLLIALVAWWWLPRENRTAAGWALRFLIVAWLLAIGQLVWVLQVGFFEHGVSWALLLILFLIATLVRGRGGTRPEEPARSAPGKLHPAIVGGILFWLLQLPHLFFPYHWTDTKDIWACRTEAFDATGSLFGIFDCLDPGRPPLHSILLWLGHTNGTIEGRLLPFLLVGAFGVVLHYFLRRVAPKLAPWGLLWFFMTVRVYQGAVSSYADVPVMLAIAVGLFLAIDERLATRWEAVLFALVAGAAASLIKRDGGALIAVGTGVVWLVWHRRRDPRTYAALAGAILGFVIWSSRPDHLYVPSVFDLKIGGTGQLVAPELVSRTAGVPFGLTQEEGIPDLGSDSTRATVGTYLTMFYGMQGQMLSHYGFGMFVPTWIILAVWVWRRREHLTPEARLYGWLALLGWLAIVGIYIVHVSTGHPYRGSLRVIRTAFGRHMVHMFVFAILSATALAEVLLARRRAESEAG
jgi:hypothetical protein